MVAHKPLTFDLIVFKATVYTLSSDVFYTVFVDMHTGKPHAKSLFVCLFYKKSLFFCLGYL